MIRLGLLGLDLNAGRVRNELPAGRCSYGSRLVFREPPSFKTPPNMRLPLPTSSPPNGWGSGSDSGLVWGRVGPGRRARLKLTTNDRQEVCCIPVLFLGAGRLLVVLVELVGMSQSLLSSGVMIVLCRPLLDAFLIL